jgi:GntR family transcriptional regulator
VRVGALISLPHGGAATVRKSTTVRSTMALRIDRSEPVALHDQVAAEIRRAIAEGEAKPGEKLPPSIDLAAILGVNRNTVLRALRILREEGIVDMTRGRGVRVIGTPQRSALITKVAELAELARALGYRRDDLIALLRELP